MKYRTATLEGAPLDAAVAKAEATIQSRSEHGASPPRGSEPFERWRKELRACIVQLLYIANASKSPAECKANPHYRSVMKLVDGGPSLACAGEEEDKERWRPSELWEQGGPIIEREQISLMYIGAQGWSANFDLHFDYGEQEDPHTGPTPLIAAMRAYTASVFGEFVELP